MSRTSSPSELLYGPLQMTLIMSYVGITHFNESQNGAIIMASFVGDAVAAVVGIHYGRLRYKIPLGGVKSVEGSIGCILGTILGVTFYLHMLDVETMKWQLLVAYGVVSALAEATAWKDWDNFVIFVIMELSTKHLPQIVG